MSKQSVSYPKRDLCVCGYCRCTVDGRQKEGQNGSSSPVDTVYQNTILKKLLFLLRSQRMITAAFLPFRSTDYGTTYERLNDKVGVKTVLSYLYVCPTNQRKVSVFIILFFQNNISTLFHMCSLWVVIPAWIDWIEFIRI